MKAKQINDSLKKSMFFEVVIGRFLGYIFLISAICCIFISEDIKNDIHLKTTYQVITYTLFILYFGCLVLPWFITDKAIKDAQKFFQENNDMLFYDKCKHTTMFYFINFISLTFVGIGVVIVIATNYVLLTDWFKINDRLNDSISTNFYNRDKVQKNYITNNKAVISATVWIFVLIIVYIMGAVLIYKTVYPEYIKLRNNVCFNNVVAITNDYKINIEGCLRQKGTGTFTPNAKINVSACKNFAYGQGWEIKLYSTYKSKYVNNIDVKDSTIKAIASYPEDINGKTLILSPYFGDTDDSIIYWKKEPTSTCIAADLC